MTRQQEIALRYHCRFAFETAQRRYFTVLGWASLCLTVNSGYE
jgi:hypothetical protein